MRKDGDSKYTRFPGVPLKPLEHLSLYSLTPTNEVYLICGCKGNNFSLKIHIPDEYLIYFNHETNPSRMISPRSACASHLVEQLFLFLCEISRQFDIVGNDQVSVRTVSPVIAFATQPHFRAILCLGFNLQFDL